MIDIGPTSNGGRRAFRITAATIAAVSSTLGVVIFLGGFITGAMVMEQKLADLQIKVTDMQKHIELISDRMAHVEDDSHYAAQGIADLKALTAGTKR